MEAIAENILAASFPWNKSLTIAAELTVAIAPKNACVARKKYKVSNEFEKNRAKLEIQKPNKPKSAIFFRPILSDNIPPLNCPRAKNIKKILIVNSILFIFTPKSWAISGIDGKYASTASGVTEDKTANSKISVM